MYRFLLILLFSFALITPRVSVGQSISEADTIRFQLSENSQFLPGKSGMSQVLKKKLRKLEIQDRNFDHLYVIGTYDEMGWKPSACDVPGDIPLQKNWQTRQDQCDAKIAKWRAVVTAQYLIDQKWLSPWDVRTRVLLDERERSVILIFVQEGESFALRRQLRKIKESQEELERKFNDLRQWFAKLKRKVESNTRRIADAEDKLANHERRISNLEKKVKAGPEFSAFFGLGGQQFARVTTPGVAGGLRLGNLELAGWYGYRPPFAAVKLPEPDGMMEYGRSSYGGSLTWYPDFLSFHDDKLELGPTFGGMHGEDYLDSKEEFITVYEAVQVGSTANLDLFGPISLSGKLLYAPVRRADVPDLKLDRSGPQWSGRVTLRVTFGE